MHYFIIKISKKREIKQMASNHFFDIQFKDFMKLYKDYNNEQFPFLKKDIALQSDIPSRFRKSLL